MLKRWPTILGLLLFVRPVWDGIKWLLDWFGRFDLIASHLHDLGVQPVLDFILNPPAWMFWPTMLAGCLLIWWDLKRKQIALVQDIDTAEIAPDPHRKLRLGFYGLCAALGVSVWAITWPTMFPDGLPIRTVEATKPPAAKPKLVSNMARTVFVCDSPHLEKPPSLAERKAQLADRLEIMHRVFGVEVTGDVAENEVTLSATINTAMGRMKQDWLAKRSGDQIFISITNQPQSDGGMSLIWEIGSLAPLDPEEDFARQSREKVEQLLNVQQGKCKLV